MERSRDPVPIEDGMWVVTRHTKVGQVAQVKVPMRLIRDGFNVSSSVLPPGGTTVVLVRAVTVVLHAAGVRQPGTLLADIRGRIGADGYLAPSAYVNDSKTPFVKFRGWYMTRICKEVNANVLHVFFEEPTEEPPSEGTPPPGARGGSRKRRASALAPAPPAAADSEEEAAADAAAAVAAAQRGKKRQRLRAGEEPGAGAEETPQDGDAAGMGGVLQQHQQALLADALRRAAAQAAASDALAAFAAAGNDGTLAATAAAAASAAAAAAAAASAGDGGGGGSRQCDVHYISTEGLMVWRKNQLLSVNNNTPFLPLSFAQQGLGLLNGTTSREVAVWFYENGLRVQPAERGSVRLAGRSAYLIILDRPRGARPFRRFIGWRLAGMAAEDAGTVRLYFESPQAAPGSTLPAADAAATGAAAAAAAAGGGGADAVQGGQELGAPPNGAAAAASDGGGGSSSRDGGQPRGPQPHRGSTRAPHWLGGGAVAAAGTVDDDGCEQDMLVDDDDADQAAAAAAAPDDGDGDRQGRSSAGAAAGMSLQLPDTRVPAVMRGALLASLPLLLLDGLSPAQAEGVAAACDAAAAAMAQRGADGGSGSDAPRAAQVSVLYGWLQLWCRRGDQQQVAAVVEQLSQLGAAAAPAATQHGAAMTAAGASSWRCQECAPALNRDCTRCWAAVQQQLQQLARQAVEPPAPAVLIRAVAAGAAARDTPSPGNAQASEAPAAMGRRSSSLG